MSKQRTGVAIFAGLLVITGIASSGWLFDANSLLNRYVKTPLMESREEALPSGVEVAEEEATDEAEGATAVEEDTATSEETTEEEVTKAEPEAAEKPVEAVESETASAPEESTSQETDTSNEQQQEEAATETDTEAESAQTEVAEAASDTEQTNQAGESATTAPAPEPPIFDLLRVEPNGDMVVAGVAQPGAELELVTGSDTLTKTTANDRGEFVAILDVPLEPGDYEIVLRSTGPDGVVMSSEETAIVSIPENGTDGVIALVETPGEPSRLITVPETETAQGEEQPETTEQEAETEVAQAPAETESENEAPDAESSEAEQTAPATETPAETTDQKIRIEAVEIDGPTVFVAGAAAPGTKLRVYANEILLGDTEASAQGRFLIEVNRELPVGDYIIRADALSPNGADVVMRAAVPFTRSAGEKLAAVAVPVAPRLPDEAPQIQTEAPANAGTESGAAAPVAQAEATNNSNGDTSEPSTGQNQAQQAESNNSGSETAQAQAGQNTSTETASAQVEQGTTLDQPLTPVENSVVIRRGDTLWHISRRVYGRGIKYTTIYRANVDQIRDPDMIWPGQVFALPEKADDTEDQ